MNFSFGNRSGSRRKGGPCGFLLLIPFGILLGIIGVVMLFSNIALVANGVKTTGTVVDMETKTDVRDEYTDDEGRVQPAETRTSYYPIIEFKKADDGTTVRYTSNFGSSSKPSVGSTRAIIYDKGNPQRAQDDSASNLWILPIVLILIGFTCLGFGILLFILAKKAAKALLGVAQGAQQGGMAGASGIIANLMGGMTGASASPGMPAIPQILPPSPVNPQLADYVKQSRAVGTDDATIRATLAGQGWSAPDIAASLRH